MPIEIKPQDRTKPEKLELELHPSLIIRLKDYAQKLNGSDISYVVSEILDQALPSDKGTKKPKAEGTPKATKTGSKKNKEGAAAT